MKNMQMRFLTNKSTIRWFTMLNMLERIKICSVNELSETMGTSTRTIINDIRDIRSYFKEDIQIESTNAGYVFLESNPEKYFEKKRELLEKEELFMILNSILLGDIRTLEDWAYEFHLSESTMKRYLRSVSDVLEEYGIKFSLATVDLVGDEINIRKFFHDFYYVVDTVPHALVPFDEIRKVISKTDEFKRLEGGTNISPADFYYYFYIMIQRSKNGHNLDLNKGRKYYQYTIQEYDFLLPMKKVVAQRIKEIYGYEIISDELFALYLYSFCKRTVDRPELEIAYCQKFNQWDEFQEIAEKYIVEYDDKLYDAVPYASILIEAFFTSVKWLDILGSIMNKGLPTVRAYTQKSSPKNYQFTVSFLERNRKKLGIKNSYLEDIAANLVLTIEAIRDMHTANSKRIAFLLEGSFFMCRTIQAKAYRYLRGYHQLFFLNIEEFNKTFLSENQIDIFVTNQSEYISEIVKEMEYVVFKAIPDTSDWNELLKCINPQITRDFLLGTTTLTKRLIN